MNEREAFEEYWNSLVTPTGASEELLHSCEFAAWYAWQARTALSQPAESEPLTEPELPQPSLLVESAQGFVDGWTRSQVRSAINLALLKQRYSQPAVPAPDRYSELAEALGCDSMDSHAGRIARAKRLAQKEKT